MAKGDAGVKGRVRTSLTHFWSGDGGASTRAIEFPADLAQRIAERGVPIDQLVRIDAGSQAVCYLIEADPPLVLKVLRPDRSANSAQTVRREVQALTKFTEATDGHPSVDCPRPLATYEEDMAYLMTFLPGRSLESILHEAAMPLDSASLVASRVIEGLMLYHDSVGEVYGDFNALNVLVSRDLRVSFLDPTPTNRLQENLGRGDDRRMLTADIGYWTYSATVRSARQMAHRSRVPFRLAKVTKLMIEAATTIAGDGPSLVRGVYGSARAHAARLGARPGRRDQLLASATAGSLRLLERRILSQL